MSELCGELHLLHRISDLSASLQHKKHLTYCPQKNLVSASRVFISPAFPRKGTEMRSCQTITRAHPFLGLPFQKLSHINTLSSKNQYFGIMHLSAYADMVLRSNKLDVFPNINIRKNHKKAPRISFH
jgi:hypothetical protein